MTDAIGSTVTCEELDGFGNLSNVTHPVRLWEGYQRSAMLSLRPHPRCRRFDNATVFCGDGQPQVS
jgi:hypothetical protein